MNKTTEKTQNTCRLKPLKQGSALLLTLLVVSLMLIVVMTFVALVRLELRKVIEHQNLTLARANARLGAELAIAEMQNLTGLDTRITASATILDENNIRLTGVWRSWEGSDRQNDGKPLAPNYAAKRLAGDPKSALELPWASGRFLGWLCSVDLPGDPNAPFPAAGVSNQPGQGRVPLVASASVAAAAEEVHIAPTLLTAVGVASGGFAWWVSGENTKAMISGCQAETPSTVQEWQQRVRGNGRADPQAFGLGGDDLFAGKALPSTRSLDLIDHPGAEPRRLHDLTVYSRGLLTNSAVGGWRRDLSLMTESYDGEALDIDGDPATFSTTNPLPPPSSTPSLPFYTRKPGEIVLSRKADNQNKAGGALLYPWASYRSNIQPWGHPGPINSWTSLVDYANQYKPDFLTSFSANQTQYRAKSGIYKWARWHSAHPKVQWADKIRVAPVIARVHWIFSIASTRDGLVTVTNAAGEAEEVPAYRPKLLLTPVVTVWNPYNVELVVPGTVAMSIRWTAHEITPFKFKFRMNGAPLYNTSEAEYLQGVSFAQLLGASSAGNQFWVRFPATEPLTLPPGATKIFSPGNTIPVVGSSTVHLVPGYGIGGGFLYDIQDFSSGSGQVMRVDGSAQFAIEAVNISPISMRGIGIGVELELTAAGDGQGGRLALRNYFNLAEDIIEAIYPPLAGDASGDLHRDQIQNFDIAGAGVPTHPFAAAILGLRGATPLASPDETAYAHLQTKGLLQTNPLSYHVEMRPDNEQRAHGSRHPVNSPYAYSFRPVHGWNDTANGWIPQVNPADGVGGYVVSGIEPHSGLTRAILAELPTRPLQSLVDLMHWDARNNNPVPPFQFNLIGNASATPLMPPDALSVPGDRPLNQHMSNDDSYLLNHVLFDDWFVSSIAPDYGNFGTSQQRGIGQVYAEHLSGARPLPNRFYLPTADAVSDDADRVVSGLRNPETNQYAFETVASRLTVAGMFNVNSTSVDAWRALLRHSRDLQVPYLNASGQTNLDSANGFPFPRSSIAGDPGGSPDFDTSPVLTEAQIDRLAEFIVDEIRKRGPFLSLSEFVNRRLTKDVDLALAGAVQAALDSMAALGNSPVNPFRELQVNSTEITTLPVGNPHYQFPQAALGSSAFGLPGWIRQADVLRPLAPLLSARDDTFTIRSYGDIRNPNVPGAILAKAWCEVLVVRTPDFVDPVDDPSVLPHSGNMQSPANQRFGRRYQVISFRWLNEEEL